MAGVDVSDVTPWNAYPWYINAAPRAAQLDAGVERKSTLRLTQLSHCAGCASSGLLSWRSFYW